MHSLRCKFASMASCAAQLFSTFVFLDTETTGLPDGKSNPHITELCLIAVSRFALEDEATHPRVQNKLLLCFNPMSSICEPAARISGKLSSFMPLNNYSGLNYTNLYHQKDLDALAIEQMQAFLLRLDPPICIVAQNGFKFDYPLINAEILRVKGSKFEFLDCKNNPVACSDTLHLFRTFSEELNDSGVGLPDMSRLSIGQGTAPVDQSSPRKPTTNSRPFSLQSVYARVFGAPHEAAHSAEGDCLAMMRLVQYLGISGISWFDSHYRSLSTIPIMYQASKNDASPLPTGKFPYEEGFKPADDVIDLTD